MKGRRFRVNDNWHKAIKPRYNHKTTGVIVGESRNGKCWRVLMDGNAKSSVENIAKDFVDLVPLEEAVAYCPFCKHEHVGGATCMGHHP